MSVAKEKAGFLVDEIKEAREAIKGAAHKVSFPLQAAAGGDQVSDIADCAYEAGHSVDGNNLLGKEADDARNGLSTVFEPHRPWSPAEIGPGVLHSHPIVGMHALRPIIDALFGC